MVLLFIAENKVNPFLQVIPDTFLFQSIPVHENEFLSIAQASFYAMGGPIWQLSVDDVVVILGEAEVQFVRVVEYIGGVVHFRRQFRATAFLGSQVGGLKTVEETVRHVKLAGL